MPLQFVRFDESHTSAVEAFNRRMIDGHAASDFLLPTKPETILPAPGDPIQWTRYVVLDGNEVRGGVLAMDQPGWLNGCGIRALNFQSPLSEGIVNPKYSVVAMQMVKFMQKQTEAVFMVGMGSADRPLPKLLTALGWSVRSVPFLFRVHHAGNFLRELRMLQSSAMKRLAAQAARITGTGALGLALKQRRHSVTEATIRQVRAWGDWADDIWQRYCHFCSFAVQRDRRTLESLYPVTDPRTKILIVERGGKPMGWSVCFNAPLVNHRHFGNLKVGSILDCLAAPESSDSLVPADAMALVATLTDQELGAQGADLVLVNHSHLTWIEAFRMAGFLSGPSNYMLALSKKLAEIIRSVPQGDDRVHVTRGDGDGRIHLA